MRRLIGTKFCMVVSKQLNFIMPVQNYGGPTSQRILGAKNMQKLP